MHNIGIIILINVCQATPQALENLENPSLKKSNVETFSPLLIFRNDIVKPNAIGRVIIVQANSNKSLIVLLVKELVI